VARRGTEGQRGHSRVRQFARTLECLRALAAHPCAVPAEVIVVDDGSPDETAERMPRIEGVRYHKRAANGGFIAACNDGASLARGEYVVFLNNDTIPQPGWLDALLRTFEDHADVGLAGSQLRYPDGRLQEAGGGGVLRWQRVELRAHASPEDCRYAYVRDCDYLSGRGDRGAARAVRTDRRLLDALRARLLRRHRPRLRGARARQARAVPARSIVVHDEGGTAGTDVQAGPKAYQVRNQAKFAERWRVRARLAPAARHRAHACEPAQAPGPDRRCAHAAPRPRFGFRCAW
jgi:glycosyltransferase involved in cell wall biosynthesis